MTGRHAGRSPVRGNTGGIPLRPQDETLAELFQWAGYRTGGFGKWGLGDIGTTGAPEKKGFDEFFGYYHQVHAHNYYPRYLVSNGEKVDLPGRRAVEEAYSHYRIVERTLAFIREHADQRFFCLAAWTPPHGKYQIPRSDPAWERFKEKNWSRAARTHAAFTSMIDRHVGELMALLRELELEEETLVFFGSDNGPSYRFEGSLRSAGEWRGQKGTMYEGGLRIPMIVRWAGQIPAASVSDLPWYFPDVLPTLAELVGVEEWVPDEAGGLSILPTLLGEERVGRSQERHDHLYWEYPPYDWILGRYHPNGLRQAVRSGDWKLVRHGHQSPWQLYDIDEDPGERTDLAGQHREVVERLSGYAERAHTSPPPQWEPATPRGRRYR